MRARAFLDWTVFKSCTYFCSNEAPKVVFRHIFHKTVLKVEWCVCSESRIARTVHDMGNWRIHLQWEFWDLRRGNCSIDIKLVRSAGFIYSPIHIHTHHTFRIVDDGFLDGRVYPCVWRFYSHKFKRFFHPHLSSYQVNLNSDQDSQVLLLFFLI